MNKRFRITPRLAIRVLRSLRGVAAEVNEALSATSPGGRRITTDEAFDIAIVVADAVVRVVVEELAPQAKAA